MISGVFEIKKFGKLEGSEANDGWHIRILVALVIQRFRT